MLKFASVLKDENTSDGLHKEQRQLEFSAETQYKHGYEDHIEYRRIHAKTLLPPREFVNSKIKINRLSQHYSLYVTLVRSCLQTASDVTSSIPHNWIQTSVF
ncbi:hypothetical protein PNOK_0131300 [Pyrrhoderma noxium]|uniref:Uncharacterized protein n=1 Tax=Pyrrhoderma noxium TaxID=2282107 RepID=A0A286UXQ6_9AGAM|nr:hypothetical protein PNOK_0131300 [Pyrrhoderma noxium]